MNFVSFIVNVRDLHFEDEPTGNIVMHYKQPWPSHLDKEVSDNALAARVFLLQGEHPHLLTGCAPYLDNREHRNLGILFQEQQAKALGNSGYVVISQLSSLAVLITLTTTLVSLASMQSLSPFTVPALL